MHSCSLPSGLRAPRSTSAYTLAQINAAFRRAGLKFAGYHGFRRGLASNLFETGCDDLTVMRVLRHASVQITRAAYIKVRDHVVESAMAKLAAAANQDANRLNRAAPNNVSR